MKIQFASAELINLPALLKKLVPTLDVTPLESFLTGVTFPAAGSITIKTTTSSPGETVTLELDVTLVL